MKTTFISRTGDDVKFTMDFTAEEFDHAQIEAYKKVKDQFELPGFRKGKAPRSLLEKHYGETIFIEDALDILLNEFYPQAVRELVLEVIDSPRVDFSKIQKGQPLTMTVTVSCMPIITVEGYDGVEIEKVDATVKDEDVEREINMLQKRNARMVLVERPAKDGDTLLLDYAGYVGEEQFEGGTAERQELILGSGMFIPGFEEQLVGVTPGEKRDVTVTFPEEYHAPKLAGKEAVFHCLVHEIKEEELPELDDEFAKDVSEFDTLEELNASIRDRLETYAEAEAKERMKDAALGKVVEENEIDVPPMMVEDEIDRMLQQLDQQLRYQGLSLDKYMQYMNKDIRDLHDEVKDDAAQAVKTRIILNGIVEAEKFEVTQEDLDEELNTMAEQYQMPVEKVKELIDDASMHYLEKDLKLKKAVDYIFAHAVIQ